MTKINDGGPAFPVELAFNGDGDAIGGVQTGRFSGWDTGMSVRDYFAAHALMGLAAFSRNENGGDRPEHFARWSYALADAMLAARNKEQA